MRSFNQGGFWDRISFTNKIIFVTVFAYFGSFFLLGVFGADFFSNYLAINPSMILSGRGLWTFISSMFVHGGFFHLFANMFSLFFMGNFLEKITGRKRLFWIYFISGIVGGAFYVSGAWGFDFLGITSGAVNIPAVGASGAVFGILGTLAVLVPFSRIYLIVGPLILIVLEVVLSGVLPTNLMSGLSILFNLAFIFMIFSLFSFNSKLKKFAVPLELPMWLLPIIAIVPLMIIARFVSLPIGNSAHLGGLVVGLVYGLYLKHKFPNKTRMISRKFR